MAKMPTRFIKLIKLTDGNIHTVEDDGCSPSGEPNGLRQQLIQLVTKTVIEKDANGQVVVDEDGRARELNLYRLAEKPPRMAWNTDDEKQAACSRADRFDETHLRRDGEWLRPSERWLRAQAMYMRKRDEQQSAADQRAAEMAQMDAGRALNALMAHGKQLASDARDAGFTRGAQDRSSPPPPAGSLASTGLPGSGGTPLVENAQHITTPHVEPPAPASASPPPPPDVEAEPPGHTVLGDDGEPIGVDDAKERHAHKKRK